MYSVEEIRENYKNFSDSKIENIARYESKGLRKEILGILKAEIEKRNLDKDLIIWVEAETDTLTDLEIKTLTRKIENLSCPNCKQKRSKLRGQEFNTIISIIFWGKDVTQNRIMCYYCGRNKKIKSFLITVFAGWWSRSGIISTPYTLLKDIINIFFQKKINDRIIAEFIEQNNGMFRLKGTDDENLFDMISWYNNDYKIEAQE